MRWLAMVAGILTILIPAASRPLSIKADQEDQAPKPVVFCSGEEFRVEKRWGFIFALICNTATPSGVAIQIIGLGSDGQPILQYLEDATLLPRTQELEDWLGRIDELRNERLQEEEQDLRKLPAHPVAPLPTIAA